MPARRWWSIVMASVSLTALPTAAEARSARHFGGHTAQGAPLVLEVARGGGAVRLVHLMAMATCSAGDPLRFALTLRITRRPSSDVTSGGHELGPGRIRHGRFRASGI